MTGYSIPKQFNDLEIKDFEETYLRNFFYVLLIFKKLKPNLEMSAEPLFVTIGSRWSYRHDCGELLPYICAKHSLRFFMSHVAQSNPTIKFRHYVVPVTQTPSYEVVKSTLENVYLGDKVLFPSSPVSSKEVARSILNHLFSTDGLGSTYVVNRDYSVKSDVQVSFN